MPPPGGGGARKDARTVESDPGLDALLDQRRRLWARVEADREQLEQLRSIVADVAERLAHDERILEEIDSVLGRNPQLRLEEADLRLRGRRLEEVAVQILAADRGAGAEIHYREWYELLRSRGHLVAGKEPLNTFLAQINRSEAVERVGRRSGRYRLRDSA